MNMFNTLAHQLQAKELKIKAVINTEASLLLEEVLLHRFIIHNLWYQMSSAYFCFYRMTAIWI